MRVPSNTGSKFPTQKPAIDKVAEHIDAVVTVATSIESGQFDKVSVPEVGTVAGISKQVVAVAEVEQYVRMLALDLSNVDKVAEELGGVLNVSNNMATVLLLHSRMADLLNIQKSLVHIDAVALNEEKINGVYEAIPEIATLVSHADKLVRIADMEPQLNAVFQNLTVILELDSNIEHIVNVSTHIDAVVKASSYVDELKELISTIQAVEDNLRVISADTYAQAEAASNSATEAFESADQARANAEIASMGATSASASWDKVRAAEEIVVAGVATTNANAISTSTDAAFISGKVVDAKAYSDAALSSKTAAANSAESAKEAEVTVSMYADKASVSEAAAKASEIAATTSENNAKVDADRAKVEADRAKSEADRASTEAGRAKMEADRAFTEAGRAQSEADHAAADAHRAEVAKSGSEQASYDAALSAGVASQKEASAVASATAAGQSAALSEQHSTAASNSAAMAGDEAAKAKVQADSAIATEQRIQQAAAGQLDSIATEGAKQIALAKSHADKAALSEQASSESAIRSEAAAQQAEALVGDATGGALLKAQNLGDVPNKEAARTNLDVPSKSQLAQEIGEAIGAVTPASIGARPDSWTPTAADVGALPVSANAVSATKLLTARTINGTNFDGTANITTANWGTTRTLTIGNSGKSVNGAGNVSWSLAEIGAVPQARTINSKPLTSDITLSAADVGALSIAGDTMTGNLTTSGTLRGMLYHDRNYFYVGTFSSGYGSGRMRGYYREHDINNPEAGGARIILDLQDGNGTIIGKPMDLVLQGKYVYHQGFKPTPADVGALPSGGTAVAATKLATARQINGTNFDGTGNITTVNWGTARTLTIGNTAKSVNGGADVAWSLSEIGAAPGGFGIGEGSRQKDPNTLHVGGLWRDTVSGLAGITLPYDGTPTSRAIGVTGSGGLRTAVRTSDAAYVWKKIYSEEDKPTSADVGLGNVNNWGATAAVNDNSDAKYATAGAVKKAYDLAAAAMPKTGGIFSSGIVVNGSIFSDSGVIRSKAAGSTSGGIHIGGGNGYAEIAPMLNADSNPVWAQSLRYYGTNDWRIGGTSRIFHQNYLPTAAQVGARPDNWMPTAADVGARPSDWMPTSIQVGARPSNWLPSLSEIGAAASADLNPLIPAASASFVYTGSTLTQMTEQLIGGERVTSFAYTDGRLTSAVEVLGSVTKTTTFNYQNETLTGFTTTEVVA